MIITFLSLQGIAVDQYSLKSRSQPLRSTNNGCEVYYSNRIKARHSNKLLVSNCKWYSVNKSLLRSNALKLICGCKLYIRVWSAFWCLKFSLFELFRSYCYGFRDKWFELWTAMCNCHIVGYRSWLPRLSNAKYQCIELSGQFML